MPLFDRKSPIRFEAFCRNLHCCCEFRRGASITHQPKVPVKNRPDATENRPDATENRPDATFLCHFATLLRHFVQRGNSDLRRIVFDFLTNTVRVGESERSTLNRYRSTARHRCLRPHVKHNWAFSFQVATADQAETDRYWNAIVGNGGQESACGWCQDKWGLSWQITPIVLSQAIADPDPDPAAAKRAFDAMMTMHKIDIAAIEAARRG